MGPRASSFHLMLCSRIPCCLLRCLLTVSLPCLFPVPGPAFLWPLAHCLGPLSVYTWIPFGGSDIWIESPVELSPTCSASKRVDQTQWPPLLLESALSARSDGRWTAQCSSPVRHLPFLTFPSQHLPNFLGKSCGGKATQVTALNFFVCELCPELIQFCAVFNAHTAIPFTKQGCCCCC